jgi:hypothetical protein
MSDTTRQNPDSYLLYEYTDKIPHTARIKVQLDETVDRDLLYEAAQEAIGRFPYFRVSLMPGEWKKRLDYLYGYYAIPLAEEIQTS